jgi:hypothetical protein
MIRPQTRRFVPILPSLRTALAPIDLSPLPRALAAKDLPRAPRANGSICVLPLPSFPRNIQMRMAFTPTGSGHPGCIFGTFQHLNPRNFKGSRANSFSHNPLSDSHPLNPVVSIFYKNGGGEGIPQSSNVSTLEPLDAYALSHLESTLTQPPTTVDSKPLTTTLSPLSATLTKNMGGGLMRSIATKDLSRLTLPSNQGLVGTPGGLSGVPEPSLRVWMESTDKFSKRSTNPLGQRTCTRSILVTAPRPK